MATFGTTIGSGGFRFYDAGHEVSYNYVQGVWGGSFQGPLLLDSGDAEGSSTALDAHWRVVNALVERNVLVGNPEGIRIGNNYSLAPTGCTIRDNIVAQAASGVAVTQLISPVSSTLTNNSYYATPATGGLAQDGDQIWRKDGYGPRLTFLQAGDVGPNGDLNDTDGTGVLVGGGTTPTGGPGFVATGSPASGSSTTMVVPAPVGVLAGDFQLAVITSTANETITGVPPGWQLLNAQTVTSPTSPDRGGPMVAAAYYSTGGDTSSVSFTKSGSGFWHAVRSAWRGVTLGQHSVTATASGLTATTPAMTPARAGALVVGVVAADLPNTSAGPYAPPTGWTERYDATRSSGTDNLSIAIAETVASSTGTSTSINLAGIGTTLVNQGITQSIGGKAWRSAIQSPNLQTDRDVGASGILLGLFALADVTVDATERTTYIDAAKAAADWLVATQSSGSWPDYRNSSSDISTTRFTSFDDGAPGIADALWQAWEHTGVSAYRTAALAGMDWIVGQAENAGTGMKRWSWHNEAVDYQYGMGQGIPGIVYALRMFADRTGSATYASYADQGAAFIESLLDADGGVRESGTEPIRNTGYLSGAAGIAFMFLRMYVSTGNSRWLTAARRPLAFLDAVKISASGGLTWPISINASGSLSASDSGRASGMEEGAAGIGWAYLNAYRVTGEAPFLTTARSAGVWLLAQATSESGGKAWADQPGGSTFHLSLNAGTAGIGYFLYDLGLATNEDQFYTAAVDARTWVLAQDTNNSWPTTRQGGTWTMPNEPSWHWGTAGVLAFLARLNGWSVDSPGMEPAVA